MYAQNFNVAPKFPQNTFIFGRTVFDKKKIFRNFGLTPGGGVGNCLFCPATTTLFVMQQALYGADAAIYNMTSTVPESSYRRCQWLIAASNCWAACPDGAEFWST